MLNNVPIPGESLTLPPNQAPYEKPVRYVEPEDALKAHLERLDKKEEGVLEMLSMGIPLQTVVEGVLRNAVYNGIHNVDVSLIVAPAIHEYVKGFAKSAGVEFKEWDEEDAPKRDPQKERVELAKRIQVPINPPPEPVKEIKTIKRRRNK